MIRRKIFYALVSRTLQSKLETAGSNPHALWTYAPGLLVSPAIIISGGVGDDISFELDLASSTDCEIYLFDPSATGIQTIAALRLPANIKFHPLGIAGESKSYAIATPSNPTYLRFSKPTRRSAHTLQFPCRNIQDIVVQYGLPKIDLLKIDIEGFEYETLDSMLKSGMYPRQICVEFHHQPTMDIPKFRKIFMLLKLYSHGYRVVYCKGNDHTLVRFS